MTFTATPYTTADDKVAFVKAFKRFVEKGCPWTLFSVRLYQGLVTHCWRHIAHYDRKGFYANWFGRTQDQLRFFQHAWGMQDPWEGNPASTWCDVEDHLRAWIVETGIRERLAAQVAAETELAERAMLASLQAKYPEPV